MKIYIIGPVGSGKTTLSEKLSKKYNIQSYELDKVSWDDYNGHIRRSDEEAIKIFNEILKNDEWIIEDIGRDKFKQGRIDADVIYYIKLSKFTSYFRVMKRWLKQRIGIERYNHPPTIKQISYYLSTVKEYYKNEKEKLKDLEDYNDKLIYIDKRSIKEILGI